MLLLGLRYLVHHDIVATTHVLLISRQWQRTKPEENCNTVSEGALIKGHLSFALTEDA